MRIELTTLSSSTDALTTDLLEALRREGSKINYYYTSHTGPVTGVLDIFKKKKCKEEKISPPITFKKRTNKQNKAKTKQSKSLVSISNVGDQLWLSLVLNRSQASADLQRQVLLWYAGRKSQAKWCNNEQLFTLEPKLCCCKTSVFHRRVNKIKFQMTSFTTC